MKNLMIAFMALLCSVSLFGQSVIQEQYRHLENHKDATVVFISGNLFGYVSKVLPDNDKESEKIKTICERIESFEFLSVPGLEQARTEYSKGTRMLRNSYEDLITVRDKTNNFSLVIKEEDDVIKELVGIGMSDDNFFVFSLMGSIDMDNISEITELIQEKKSIPISTKNNSIGEFKVYPNPVASNSELKIDVPSDLMGSQITVMDASGNMVKQVTANEGTMSLGTEEMSAGQYIIDITKGDFSIKKRVLVIQ